MTTLHEYCVTMLWNWSLLYNQYAIRWKSSGGPTTVVSDGVYIRWRRNASP